MQYPINEIFSSIQGEGYFTGTPSLFIRLQGCEVQCAWCDTQYSWALDEHQRVPVSTCLAKQAASAGWCEMDVDAILAVVRQQPNPVKHIVLTGGEPATYDLRPLTHALEAAGFRCALETSGTEPVRCSLGTWVTLSPKLGMKGKKIVREDALLRANEWKYPIARTRDVDRLLDLLNKVPDRKAASISLQPVNQDPNITQFCIEMCLKYQWRLSVQLHKYIAVR